MRLLLQDGDVGKKVSRWAPEHCRVTMTIKENPWRKFEHPRFVDYSPTRRQIVQSWVQPWISWWQVDARSQGDDVGLAIVDAIFNPKASRGEVQSMRVSAAPGPWSLWCHARYLWADGCPKCSTHTTGGVGSLACRVGVLTWKFGVQCCVVQWVVSWFSWTWTDVKTASGFRWWEPKSGKKATWEHQCFKRPAEDWSPSKGGP